MGTTFYQQGQFFRDGRILIYKRSDASKNYQYRLLVDGIKNYIIKSCKTSNIGYAVKYADYIYDKYRFKIMNHEPLNTITFDRLYDEWIAGADKSEKRQEFYDGRHKIYFSRYFGKYKLDEITQTYIDGYLPWRRAFYKTYPELIKGNVAIKPSTKSLKMEQTALREIYCPFCGSDIKELPLIKTYSMYFNKEYLSLKEKVSSYNKLPSFINDSYNKRIELLEANKKAWDSLWKSHIKEEFEDFVFKDIDALVNNLDALVIKKEKSLLDAISELEVDNFIKMYGELGSFYEKVETYIKSLNEKIQLFKKNLGDGNLTKEKAHLFELQVTAYQKSLLDDDKWKQCVKLCNDIVTLKQKTIPTCKDDLDKMIEKNCEAHQKNINDLLKKMNAKFSLELDKKLSYITKEANYNYYIKIGEKKIPIKSDDNDSFACPCLGNCLSEGDKTSLAFAFFLSKLESCPELEKRVIVFDDPISSLDEHRRSQTISFVNQYANKALSCFVFSHDAYFLKKLYKNKSLKSNEIKLLEMVYTISDGSIISECDIFEKTKSQFVKDFECLNNYKAGADLRVAGAIRTYVEGLLKRIAPNEFKEEKWLGDYIDLIRKDTSHYLHKLLQEISDINDYAKEFHHDSCTDEACSVVNEQELKGYVDRALGLRKSIIN